MKLSFFVVVVASGDVHYVKSILMLIVANKFWPLLIADVSSPSATLLDISSSRRLMYESL